MKEVLVSFKYKAKHGEINGIYVVSVEDWKKIRYLQKNNKKIHLYDVVGKHSELELSTDLFILISKDDNEISTFKNLFGNTFGNYKPLDYALELYEELTYTAEEGGEY